MAWHIRLTRAVSIPPATLFTTPAIPHMASNFQNSARGLAGFVSEARVDPSQTIVAIVPWVALPPIARRKNNVGHLPGSYKVKNLRSIVSTRDQIAHELPHGFANNAILLTHIHAMAVQLNEQPIRTTQPSNCSPLPPLQPEYCRSTW